MNDSIILSEKHGVNPSLEVCTLCNEDMSVILFGKLPDDKEAPKRVCLGHVCDKCIKKLEENKERVFIEVSDNGTVGSRYCIVKDEDTNIEKPDRVIYLSESVFESLI